MSKTVKDSITAMNEIKQILSDANLGINGDVRILQRVLGSKKEDVVINTLLWDAEQVQQGIININVHVPNLTGQPSANPTGTDNTQPNTTRMKEIGAKITQAVEDFAGPDYMLTLRSPGEIDSNGLEWIYNIQVDYNYLRTD